jgi:hypothetical protein
MPWKYVMPTDTVSMRTRETTLGRISAWWQAFAERLGDIEANLLGQTQWDLKAWMDEQIQAIHPRLRWEFGQDLGGRYLVITCESAHHLQPMVESIVRRAPEIANWSFREFRPAQEAELIPELVRARTGHHMSSTTVQARLGQCRQIDFVFQSLLAHSNDKVALDVARVALDYLIGEDVVQRWGGHLDIVELSHTLTHSFVPLPRVRSIVLDLISGVLSGLPDRPYWKMPKLSPIESKFRPDKADEYGKQDDAMFGTTVIPELRDAGFKPGFSSSRFSRQGEMFCYLKIDMSEATLDDRYKRKKIIEEAMDTELREEGIGAIVGTATGRKYIYFDLAVMDVVKTLDATRRRLLALELLPTRSWLMFYDADLSGEYIGLRSATPPPPLWEPPKEVEPERKKLIPIVEPQSKKTPPPPGALDNPSWLIDPIRD